MKRQKIGGGEHACIRDDFERIHSYSTCALEMMMPLVDLTYQTRQTHSVHDFTEAAAGRKLEKSRPALGVAKGLRELYAISYLPIENGDVVISEQDGKTASLMVFDVVQEGRDVFKMKGVAHIPELKIGHPSPQPQN